jgi:outer membrane lipoprotein-sorting protein
MRLQLFVVLVFLIGWLAPAPTPLEKHVTALATAKAMRATISVQRGLDAPVEETVVAEKPNHVRAESPSQLLVSDGTVVVSLDKAANEYAEKSVESLLKEMASPELWGFSAFFDRKSWDEMPIPQRGAKRTVLGANTTEYTVKLKDGAEVRVLIEDSTGLAKGWTYKKGNSETLVVVRKLEILEAVPADVSFRFTPPADAKKTGEGSTVSAAVRYAQVRNLLMETCMPCHSSSVRTAGYEFETYEGTLRAVRPGDPDRSVLVRVVSGSRPKMPQGRAPLTAEQVKLLRDWIAAGAKKDS